MRNLWTGICYFGYLLCKYIPRFFGRIMVGRKLRGFFAKRIVASAGKNINVEKGATFGRRLTIGNHSGLGINCNIQGTVRIGNYVMMGPDVLIYTSNHAYKDPSIPMCQQGYEPEKAVTIGNDVWIGARVIILPGVHIGDGTVIGAGTVVAEDVPDYCVYAGNPARVVRNRQ